MTTAATEAVNSYEAGIKSEFWNGRARINLTGFYFRTNDQQLTAVGGAGNFNQLLNADAVVGSGFEFDADFRIADGLTLTAGVSLNNTRIDGNPLPQAPCWIAKAAARYAAPFRGGEVFVHTDWAYRSRINFFLYERAEFQDANELIGGARIGCARAGWEYSAYGRNITNDLSVAGAIDFNNFSGYVNEPPLWGVEIARRF